MKFLEFEGLLINLSHIVTIDYGIESNYAGYRHRYYIRIETLTNKEAISYDYNYKEDMELALKEIKEAIEKAQ